MKTWQFVGLGLLVWLTVIVTNVSAISYYEAPATYSKRVVATEEPFHIDLEIGTLVIDQQAHTLTIDGRFWVSGNVSVPAGNKYLGFTFDAELADGDLWYRDYGSEDPLVHLGPADFSHVDSKCLGGQCYDHVYYTTFPTVPSDADKEFRLSFTFAERPERFLLYFGTGSTGIEITADKQYEILEHADLHFKFGNGKGTGGEGHIGDVYTTGVAATDYTSEYMQYHYPNSEFKTTGTCTYTENGTVRAMINCTDGGDHQVWYVINGRKVLFHMSDNSADYSFINPKLTVAGEDLGVHDGGDGSWDGASLLAAGDTAVTEGWQSMYHSGGNGGFLGIVWNMNETTGNLYTADDGATYTLYEGYHDNVGAPTYHFPANTWVYKMFLIGNSSETYQADKIRMYWNESFWSNNINLTVNNGTATQKSRFATMLNFSGASQVMDITLHNPPVIYNNMDGLLTIQTQEMTGDSFYLYNKSGTSTVTQADVLGHYNWDGGPDQRWECGVSHPTCVAGNPIPAGEIQFCNATTTCTDNDASGTWYTVFNVYKQEDMRLLWGDDAAVQALLGATTTAEEYKTNVTEYESTRFYIKISTTNNTVGYDRALLVWNGTEYDFDTSINATPNDTLQVWSFNKTLVMPDINKDFEDVTFYWSILQVRNDTSTVEFNSTAHTQRIHQPFMSKCNSTLYIVKRLVLRNETADFGLVNGTLDGDIFFTIGTHTYEYNFTFFNISHEICLWPTYLNITASGKLQYTANESISAYSVRDYNFQNLTFDNVSEDIDLYLLDSDDSSRVVFYVKDEFGSPYRDVVVEIQRYYPELNSYRTVAAPLSDSSGETNSYLKLYDVYYRFVLKQYGETLNVIPSRLVTSSEVTLVVDPTVLVDWLKLYGYVTGSCAYNVTTGYLGCAYNDASGLVDYMKLDVYRLGTLSKSAVCEYTNSTLPSGTFRCLLGANTTDDYSYAMYAKLTTGSQDEYTILTGLLERFTHVSMMFGNCHTLGNATLCMEGVAMTVILVLAATMVGVFSPSTSILMMLAGLGVSVYTGMFAISAQMFIGLVFVAGILVYRMR